MPPRNKAGAPKAAALQIPADEPHLEAGAAPADEAAELPARFRFRARGASMFVVDTETDREAGFPKSSTGVVAKVLGGLFSEAGSSSGRKDWRSKLPARWQNAKLGIKLAKTRVAVDPAHPNVVLGAPADHPEGHVVLAYAVTIQGKDMGYVLAHAEEKFSLLLDARLQRKVTQHRSFVPATLRLEILAQGLADEERERARA